MKIQIGHFAKYGNDRENPLDGPRAGPVEFNIVEFIIQRRNNINGNRRTSTKGEANRRVIIFAAFLSRPSCNVSGKL